METFTKIVAERKIEFLRLGFTSCIPAKWRFKRTSLTWFSIGLFVSSPLNDLLKIFWNHVPPIIEALHVSCTLFDISSSAGCYIVVY
jgi:hypothetical protein